ncbi:hypothetical protein FRB95_006280 [Tulasnella sp. JGI-2019a]|nr:hypothetical protein FRB93_011085 [Tulasnella sp. JGI-2019a]KAG9028602.1 hypothetical protein FRB95_006280 [Tulasnella sp. JGI-2019a]
MDEERLVDWFSMIMRKAPKDGPVDNVPAEEWRYRATIDEMSAGILFLTKWNAAVVAADAETPASYRSYWTSPETIRAFASWLSDYGSEENMEIKVDSLVVMQMPIDHDLVARFVGHAALANSQIDWELRLQSIFLKRVSRIDHAPRQGVSNAGQDQQAARDVTNNADLVGCEWCAEGSVCMHCNSISISQSVSPLVLLHLFGRPRLH